MLKLYTVVHPIGPESFPDQPEGWRWAIHTDDRLHQWSEGVINAGQESSQGSAEAVLSMVLVSIRRALVAAGVEHEVIAEVMADCPLDVTLSAEIAKLI